MKFGMTTAERNEYRRAKALRGKFVLFPRRLDSGRWAWLERVPYTDKLRLDWDGAWRERTYHDTPEVP